MASYHIDSISLPFHCAIIVKLQLTISLPNKISKFQEYKPDNMSWQVIFDVKTKKLSQILLFIALTSHRRTLIPQDFEHHFFQYFF